MKVIFTIQNHNVTIRLLKRVKRKYCIKVVLLPVFYIYLIVWFVATLLSVFFILLIRIHMVKVYCMHSSYHENHTSLSPATILYKHGAANHLKKAVVL